MEVKNWSGTIELQPDGSWLQIRRNGTSQKHTNVVSFLDKHLVCSVISSVRVVATGISIYHFLVFTDSAEVII